MMLVCYVPPLNQTTVSSSSLVVPTVQYINSQFFVSACQMYLHPSAVAIFTIYKSKIVRGLNFYMRCK